MIPTARVLHHLLKLATDFWWTLDARLTFTAASGPLIDRGLLDARELIGQPLAARITPAEPGDTGQQRALADLAAGRPFGNLRCTFNLTDGSPHPFALSGLKNPARRAGADIWQGVAIDLTRHLDRADNLRQMAYHDALTGLPNRRLFADRLEQAIYQARRRGTRVAVMLIDIDNFKVINDQYGHAAGDATLIAIGQHLGRAIRQSDTVARHGGDEFVILLPQIETEHDTGIVAGKILDTLATLHPHSISASLGIALYPDHGWDGASLLNQADRGMYVAKREGGHRARLATAA